MSRTMMSLSVPPDLLVEQPEVVGRLLRDKVLAQPDAFWIVLLADAVTAQQFMEFHVWHAAPPKPVAP